jgi:hypothetical protein
MSHYSGSFFFAIDFEVNLIAFCTTSAKSNQILRLVCQAYKQHKYVTKRNIHTLAWKDQNL